MKLDKHERIVCTSKLIKEKHQQVVNQYPVLNALKRYASCIKRKSQFYLCKYFTIIVQFFYINSPHKIVLHFEQGIFQVGILHIQIFNLFCCAICHQLSGHKFNRNFKLNYHISI